MRQLPILRDGVVVNVVQLDDDTFVGTKAECKALAAREEEEYQGRLEAWRAGVREKRERAKAVFDALEVQVSALDALKAKATANLNDAQSAALLRQMVQLEKEIALARESAKGLEEIPPKPTFVRGKRWFYPEGCTPGPLGGNIGETWDGEKYVRPEKVVVVA